MDDAAAFDNYENPNNMKPASPGRFLPRQALSSHVPIRFAPEILAQVKVIAAAENMTVSGWIRQEVEKAIDRRLPRPHTGFYVLVTDTNSSDARVMSDASAADDDKLDEDVRNLEAVGI
jgi:hypothetical protein